jgi:hypothetical protein
MKEINERDYEKEKNKQQRNAALTKRKKKH